MRIIMIIPSLGGGGSERVLSSLVNDWTVNEICEVEVVVLTNTPDFYVIDDRVKIHRMGYVGGRFKVLGLIKTFLKLRMLIKDTDPDICLSFLRQSNIITLLSTVGLKKSVFISERDSPLVKVPKTLNLLRKKLYPRANGIIVQTEDYKNFVLKSSYSRNVAVIPNPVRDIRCDSDKREKIIINVGRLIPEKGQKYLLEAFSMCENVDEWKLVIVGDGILKNALVNRAKELGIDRRVTFVGTTKDVDHWLCKSSIFAFTSISEGFPNALAEAMSASLPCISFNCITGPKELITDDFNGYLVEVGDVSTFADRINKLMDSEVNRKRLGMKAKESTERLNLTHISKQYFDFLNN